MEISPELSKRIHRRGKVSKRKDYSGNAIKDSLLKHFTRENLPKLGSRMPLGTVYLLIRGMSLRSP